MKYKLLLASTALFFTAVCSVHAADSFPYPNPGTKNTNWYKFTAKTTGPITAYFIGSKAGFEENIVVASNGNWLGATALSNRYLKYGDSITFGYASAGQEITIYLSIPEKNAGVWSKKVLIAPGTFATPNGVYSTEFPGEANSGIPAGTYVGFEDLAYTWQHSDWDYNDSAYVFTNVKASLDN